MDAALPPMPLLISLGTMLLVAGYTDIISRTIPNPLNLMIALLAPFYWIATGIGLWPDLAWQIGLAALVFAIFAGFNAIGMIGGGDVKLLGALALWVPPGALLSVLFVMALAGGLLAIAYIIRMRIVRNAPRPELPYGLAIMAAGLGWIHQTIS